MTSDILIQVRLDEDKMPGEIYWTAPDGGVTEQQKAKAMMLGLWDGAQKTAVRIDLWGANMEINEMNDFYYQTFYGMAETYARATRNAALADELKAFAKDFLKKATDAPPIE